MTDEWKPEYDETVAASLIGKYVLVGITYRNASDAVDGYSQKHGKIISADKKLGIVIRNPDTGEEFTLPPDTSRFEKAKPGNYRLKSTGEVITDPDFVCTWTVYPPRHDS
jgi:hypothetical protein